MTVKDKEIAVPGEVLAEGMDYLPGQGTYREGDRIIAGRLGLASIEGRAVKLIPLSGKYIPKMGDTIICQVIDVGFSGWRVETNSAYSAMLSVKDAISEFIRRGADITHYFNVGDYIVAQITNVTSQKLIDVSTKGPGLRKLHGGRILEVNTNKVPRIIGKSGSMVSMIKDATGCRIIVGQNGLIWLDGAPEAEFTAVEAIQKIASEAHLPGLTEKIKKFLEEKTGKKIEAHAPSIGEHSHDKGDR